MSQSVIKTKNYTVTVKAIGYETLVKTIQAVSLADARKTQYSIVDEWLVLNDIDNSAREFAFVEIN